MSGTLSTLKTNDRRSLPDIGAATRAALAEVDRAVAIIHLFDEKAVQGMIMGCLIYRLLGEAAELSGSSESSAIMEFVYSACEGFRMAMYIDEKEMPRAESMKRLASVCDAAKAIVGSSQNYLFKRIHETLDAAMEDLGVRMDYEVVEARRIYRPTIEQIREALNDDDDDDDDE